MTLSFILLAQSVTGAVITIIALLLVAAVIGYFTAWFYAKSVYTPVIRGLETDKENLIKKVDGLNEDVTKLNGKVEKLNDKIRKIEEEIKEREKEIMQLKEVKKERLIFHFFFKWQKTNFAFREQNIFRKAIYCLFLSMIKA